MFKFEFEASSSKKLVEDGVEYWNIWFYVVSSWNLKFNIKQIIAPRNNMVKGFRYIHGFSIETNKFAFEIKVILGLESC